MTRAGEGEGRRFALNCGPTSERKRKTKHVPFGERRGGSSVLGCNANATRAMYSQNRLTGRHRNHYSHQNLRCSAYASHCPKTTSNLQPIPPPFDPLARIKRPLVRRKAMVHRKITYYKMLTQERRAEIAAAVGATDLCSQARFAAGQSPSSLEPSYEEEEEADPMFMAEVAAQKAPDGYETMDVDFVPASESPMVQADQRFNMAILKEDREAEAQLDAERAHAAAIEALLQAEPDVVDVNRAAEAQLEAERADAAAIEALLQAEPDVLDLNRAAEARLDAERADAAAIEALHQAEPDVLDLNRAVLSSVQSARTLRLNE